MIILRCCETALLLCVHRLFSLLMRIRIMPDWKSWEAKMLDNLRLHKSLHGFAGLNHSLWNQACFHKVAKPQLTNKSSFNCNMVILPC